VPQWVLECLKRNFKFKYSQIIDASISRLQGTKPNVSHRWRQMVETVEVYQRADLQTRDLMVRMWPIRSRAVLSRCDSIAGFRCYRTF
jgi:hypothetical protein